MAFAPGLNRTQLNQNPLSQDNAMATKWGRQDYALASNIKILYTELGEILLSYYEKRW